ncbi:IGHMBP2 family helicase [Methanofervidicoccus abyssi]|uniref:DNA helicase n=1 Tax=Methanofervidicoccus abyssi TaxID=2082189 RepID=A0A401HQW7_9EURY|nr:IGHMBP2 family helicase [Methanofervidicoccus abyssi]GBF36605.1 hypothetical protein MHHB_P0835 [Methanofervidicoccus abyssi]
MKVETYVNHLKNLVELERKAEIEAMKEEMRKLSGQEREKVGRAILGLNGKVVGEEFKYKLVKYGRKKEIKTEIGVGDLVVISRNNPLRSNLVGTVTEKGKHHIVVALENVPSWALKNVRIDLYANDVTFRRQIENLDKLSESGIKVLKYVLELEEPKKSKEVEFEPQDENLNESQKKAVSLSLGSEDFFLIHGPFGTGKTRTVTEVIIQEVKRGKKVLATAESNIAVDNLVERLWGKVKLVRVGHPSKVSKHLKESTLYYQIEAHEKYKEVKRLRKKAERLVTIRDKYLKPTPQWRRGLSDEEILKFAERGIGIRGISVRNIRSMAQWITVNMEIQRLYDEARRIEEEIIKEVIDKAEVVLSTNSSVALEYLEGVKFDVAVIDEASQATIPSVLIPIGRCDKFILAGDHKQLPPTILSEKAQELSKTLFEKLIELYPSKSKILEIQYRMNEKLMEFPSREFYGGRIRAYEGVKNISLLDLGVKEVSLEGFWKYILDPKEPLVFVDTSQHPEKWEKQRRGSTSKENPLEAEVVKKILERLIKMDIPPESIGVITPYEDQRDLIDTLIGNYGVEVKTVDGYQGREKEVIVLSLVRSNRDGELGFLTDMRRLNVSLTRAKRKLIVIGDCETLKIHPTYKRFIEFVERKGTLVLLNSKNPISIKNP